VVRILSAADLDDALKAFAAIDEIALVAAPGITDDASRDKLVTHCVQHIRSLCDSRRTGERQRFDDADADSADANPGVMPKKTDYAAWYFPWIKVFDPAAKMQSGRRWRDRRAAQRSPGGHLRARRQPAGGAQSPGNEAIFGALNVTQAPEQGRAGRLEPERGQLHPRAQRQHFAWGARTVGGDANADLKYINVRRTLLFLRESIDEGLQWAVFEPNNPALWQKINRNVTAFLTNVWRSGALFGSTPQEAFYVRVRCRNQPA
jgi:phage tail sheath protein FI